MVSHLCCPESFDSFLGVFPVVLTEDGVPVVPTEDRVPVVPTEDGVPVVPTEDGVPVVLTDPVWHAWRIPAILQREDDGDGV